MARLRSHGVTDAPLRGRIAREEERPDSAGVRCVACGPSAWHGQPLPLAERVVIDGRLRDRGEEANMTARFNVGDHVSWNSEAGRVSGRIIKVHTRDFEYKGYTHHATPEEPQYEIKSDKTDHIAAHKGSALRKL